MGSAPPFSNYEQRARLSRKVANLGPVKRSSTLILRMDTAARQVCMAARRDIIMSNDSADQISKLPQEYFAQGAANSAHRELICFSQY